MSAAHPRVVVVGGANLDIKGKAAGILMPRTSNPGNITICPGGVARNIAEDLARLDVDSVLISAFGTDAFSRLLTDETRAAGVNLDHSLFVDDATTSIFVAMMTHLGDLDSAIADMGILDRLTPDVLQRREDVLRGSRQLMPDHRVS